MDSGVASGVTKIPCSTLKEKLLDHLGSNKVASEDLANLLKITRLFAHEICTVRQLVESYEKRFGQLSLGMWEYIFRQCGFKDDFHQHVAADLAARQGSQPVNIQGQDQQQNRADDKGPDHDVSSEMLAAMSNGFSNRLAISESLGRKLHATATEFVGNIKDTDQNPSDLWPQWNFPARDPKDAPKGTNNHDSAVEASTESGFFSVTVAGPPALLEELQKSLREKEAECADLKHELEDYRGKCAQQLLTIEELTRRLAECRPRLMKMTQEKPCAVVHPWVPPAESDDSSEDEVFEDAQEFL